MPASLENSARATGLEKLSLHSNAKERQCQRMFKLLHNALISHTSKAMLKIFQAGLQQYVNHELPDVPSGFRKGRGIRDQIAKSIRSSKKQESFRKTSTSALLTIPKPLTLWITSNWKTLQEMGILDHLTCLREICIQVKRQQVELDMEQWTDSKLGKEYVKAVNTVTLLIKLICRVHHVKTWAGGSTSWNQDCQEIYQ